MRQPVPEPAPASEREGSADVAAFEQFYGETLGDVTRWLVRLGVASRDWHDAIQEVYLEAWSSWSNYDLARGNYHQWVRGITFNVASRYRKRAHLKAQREEPQVEDFDAASSSPNSEDFLVMNDRARFTLQCFESISTLPLAILIAHDMNNEPMSDIAAHHNISVPHAYRLRNEARDVFVDGYDREQKQRRRAGALILPVSALSLLKGPHEVPQISPDVKRDLWNRIFQAIVHEPGPVNSHTPSHGAPARSPSHMADVPRSPLAPAAQRGGGPVVRAIRSALVAHPIAGPALIFIGGAVAALAAEHFLAAPDSDARASIAQEAPSARRAEALAVTSASAGPMNAEAISTSSPSASEDTPKETSRDSAIDPAEARQFDIARLAFKGSHPDNALEAIQAYLKLYPQGHWAGSCEKMQILVLIRVGRVAEAQRAVESIRSRSPNNPLLKELESKLSSR